MVVCDFIPNHALQVKNHDLENVPPAEVITAHSKLTLFAEERFEVDFDVLQVTVLLWFHFDLHVVSNIHDADEVDNSIPSLS